MKLPGIGIDVHEAKKMLDDSVKAMTSMTESLARLEALLTKQNELLVLQNKILANR